jgi:hypothetical protein
MDAHTNSRPVSEETEMRVTHFIPSVELTGSLPEKLGKLDILVDHLIRLRAALAGAAPVYPVGFPPPRRGLIDVVRERWVRWAVMVAVFVTGMLVERAWIG